ncbi:MAG: 16S rRNA processing protein RimM [Nitrospinaceae bacterium]|jgi:16S rRNA processing protein RimM|nr:16S rRNA processing protein RimM [Nitrospinaceae bacterium]MBT3434592.1 16S rRNA processing protein RimM [Nitrospinaceae bacterium]MBT3821295.1 16S rRNA processing protein RimM [Nitrospinaceae bacterium]MBT4094659.1 16S rRNA processing protein RimM [Nitrospinaceae bacterium]MBT4431666.1 16S rRNA processing protein RimM [Nitrospinaceae bacterium]
MDGRVAVGEAVKAQGLKGEVRVRPWLDDIETYGEIAEVFLASDPSRRFEIVSFKRGGKGSVVWKFKGIDSLEAAESLRGSVFLVDRNILPGPEEGVHYWEDFENTEAVDETGRSLGRIVDMFGAGGNDIIVIKGPKGEELLLPAMKEVVLRREGDRWVFRPPEYLDDLGEGDSDAL